MRCTSLVVAWLWVLSLYGLWAHGATATPPTPGMTISLDVQHADVRDVLRLLAETGGVNMLTSDDVRGTITTRLLDVPWEQALEAVLRLAGLAQERQGNVILVAPAERLRSARQERLRARQLAAQTEPSVTRVIPIHYARASELKAHLERLLGTCATITVDSRTNSVILTGTPTCLRAGGREVTSATHQQH